MRQCRGQSAKMCEAMPNGKPGDHPVTDVVEYSQELFSPRVNALLRDIAAMGEGDTLDSYTADLVEAERLLGSLEVRLNDLRERLRVRRRSTRE
jgi:hypothetical protein